MTTIPTCDYHTHHAGLLVPVCNGDSVPHNCNTQSALGHQSRAAAASCRDIWVFFRVEGVKIV